MNITGMAWHQNAIKSQTSTDSIPQRPRLCTMTMARCMGCAGVLFKVTMNKHFVHVVLFKTPRSKRKSIFKHFILNTTVDNTCASFLIFKIWLLLLYFRNHNMQFWPQAFFFFISAFYIETSLHFYNLTYLLSTWKYLSCACFEWRNNTRFYFQEKK